MIVTEEDIMNEADDTCNVYTWQISAKQSHLVTSTARQACKAAAKLPTAVPAADLRIGQTPAWNDSLTARLAR